MTYMCCGCGVEIQPDFVKRCECATQCAFNRGEQGTICLRTPEEGQARLDLSYLEQAEAHADEGPLGEPAARSILAIALKYARLAALTNEKESQL